MTALAKLLHLTDRFLTNGLPNEYSGNEAPLSSELFSADQMAQHGKKLAAFHKIALGSNPDKLLKRLADNEAVLSDVCELLTAATKANRRITPAGEWLLDNFYLIEEQIRTAKRHLPKGYSRELPRLANGPSADLPRVYDIALTTIAHGDGRVDPENLNRFLASYQVVSELKIGELWAIPIVLRLALIENLRRVAVRIAAHMIESDLADTWADRMIEVATNDPKSLILVVADMARSNPPMGSSFVSEFSRRLLGQSSSLSLGLTWIEQRLSETSVTIEQLVQAETQSQAIDQVSISNSIGSLRALGAMDWRKFVERQSVVEQVFLDDPIYGEMDFLTRDHYRHTVEKVARKSKFTEGEVAAMAMQLSVKATAERGMDDRTSHVGYYLIDDGLTDLETFAKVRHPLGDLFRRLARRFPLFFYLMPIVAISLTASILLILRMKDYIHAAPVTYLFGFVALICTSQLALALVNWLATLLAHSRPLPKLDYTLGVPEHARTLIAVPTLLVNSDNVNDLIETLEVRFLANRDDNIHLALLTDFTDAPTERTEKDQDLLLQAQHGIEELNKKYKNGPNDIFFLFHRPRKWNEKQNTWMGYERKRGKLAALNAALRGKDLGNFQKIVGDISILASAKFVITLDTDTQLPRETARQFVGAMMHPLNRVHFDEKKNIVTQGYGILQPRVGVSLPNERLTKYAGLYGHEPGIDPYTRTVSDVYQDLFYEGSFIGKGIYDIDAFERGLNGRFPENRILSHDLLEGCYVRSGLLSDVQLYEEYPSSYLSDVSRRHRWIRGDWQIFGWLFPFVTTENKTKEANPLSPLSVWKIFDNLRRSLVAPSLLILLVLGWTMLTPAWFWTAAVVSIIFVPPLMFSGLQLFRKPDDSLVGQHILGTFSGAAVQFSQSLFLIACLPFEAYFSLDAIGITLWRFWITGKSLLSWNPSGSLYRKEPKDVPGIFLKMIIAPMTAAAVGTFLYKYRQDALPIAAPFLLAWFFSPVIVWWISQPIVSRRGNLSAQQNAFLQKVARRTWAFFEVYVNDENNWLPPDNYQELPVARVAHRTSPTNMGLCLLANLTAHDFGFIQTSKLIERCEKTLATMQGLERHRGHLYNWYETTTKTPLAPRYISTVDSGNLAGHLITLNSGLRALPDQKVLSVRMFEGLHHTLAVLADCLNDSILHKGNVAPEIAKLDSELVSNRGQFPNTFLGIYDSLMRLSDLTVSLSKRLSENFDPEVGFWIQKFEQQLNEAKTEIHSLAPWATLPDVPKTLLESTLFNGIPTLNELASLSVDSQNFIQQSGRASESLDERKSLGSLLILVSEGSRRAKERIEAIDKLILSATDLSNMEYEFLFDKERRLLAIGYNADDRRLDASYYDLLASEARLCNFVAIAQGQLPQESWFALGRLLTTAGGDPVLFSWSGSMFEYLMPLIVMPTYEGTILDQTYKACVARQIEYGKQRNIPWGISESGYNAVDVHLNYQYRAFGVPGLGLKRGLAQDLVIAPYATALALMVAPEESCTNLERMHAEGFVGRYGFYEAIDYTASRIPRGQTHATVTSYMAHHQGMAFLSIAYLLLDKPMQKRFEADPAMQATILLLQERIPRASAFHSQTAETADMRINSEVDEAPVRYIDRPDTSVPAVQLLSNGRYHVMITNSGGGYSRSRDIAVTRWREDTTCDNWGTFCYFRDVASGEFWSNAHQPTLKTCEQYQAIFSESRVEFKRRDFDFDTHTEIVVSSEDDIELRRVRVTNRSRYRRTIEVTTYAEVVLAPPSNDWQHPAFSNLFVQTEILPKRQAILCNRRPRSEHEQNPWMFHLLAVHGAFHTDVSYETDRMKFIGRGNTLVNPTALKATKELSGSQGSVLDPIVAIRCRITLDPEESATINMVTGVADNRDGCLALVEKYQDRRLADRVFDLAWTHSQVVLRQINADEADGQLYARLASYVLYANSALRADASVLMKNRRGQQGLWGYAISGDLPIVLLQIKDPENIDLVRQLVQAHAYWRLKGLAVDLVIFNEDRAGYRQLIQEMILGLIASGAGANLVDKPGGIFVRASEQISNEDRILMQTVARAIIKDSHGTLAEQLARRNLREIRVPKLAPTKQHKLEVATLQAPQRADLVFYNGTGGFTNDGREYVIATTQNQVTPAPWVNVLANPYFGTVVSESGQSYTWLENAHEFRLTPWHNDPVTDSAGESYYLRDEETGYFWSPSPLPVRGATPYVTRHGFGYSVFEHTENGITSELQIFVAHDAPVKFAGLKIRNHSGRTRKLSATAYIEWVLGDLRSKTAMHVFTEIDPKSGALLARNPYNADFGGRIAFLDVDDTARSLTGDRTEFLGRNGSLAKPAAMLRTKLSGKVGSALDSCGAIQVPLELSDGEEREIVFRLGIGQDATDATNLIQRFRGGQMRSDTFEALCQYWKHTLGAVNVQ
ncbi:MAG: cyclic beta 1-2 glucan synthetase, partial [Leptolyngbya sp.]|nr:cyclic beta 1-2 glucan synthetase [Candidatus Melainabacteria bacterium]